LKRLALAALLLTLSISSAAEAQPAVPIARAAAPCADYSNQAAAQRAADTRDAGGDGIYCESLPCPCLKSGQGSPAPRPQPRSEQRGRSSCTRPRVVVDLVFSAARYPNIRRHFLAALRRGWPRILVINRPGADARRDKLLEDIPTRPGFDRDEYPPAVGRGRGRPALKRGSDPTGWRASVRYVRSGENRSHGSRLGDALSPYCNGTRFRYVFS
jgi:hypothetical protein